MTSILSKGKSLFSSAQIFVSFLCSPVNTRVPVVMYTRVKCVFNVRYMMFLVCLIGSGKIDLTHFLMDTLQLHSSPSFSHRECYYGSQGLLLQLVCFWISIRPSHMRLLIVLSFQWFRW